MITEQVHIQGRERPIGVVGGIGPEAGLSIVQHLYYLSSSLPEGARPNVVLLSIPRSIPSRNDFLMGLSNENPGRAIGEAIRTLWEYHGSKVVGIACNAAHEDSILAEIRDVLGDTLGNFRFVNLIESVTKALSRDGRVYGYMSILGTYTTRVYEKAFNQRGINYRRSSPELAKRIHNLVWDKEYGLKFTLPRISDKCLEEFQSIVQRIRQNGIDEVVLACTELPILAQSLGDPYHGVSFIDANEVFANALYAEYEI